MADVSYNHGNLESAVSQYNSNADSLIFFLESNDGDDFMQIKLKDAEYIAKELVKRISEFRQAAGIEVESKTSKLLELLTDEEYFNLRLAFMLAHEKHSDNLSAHLHKKDFAMAEGALNDIKKMDALHRKFA